MPSRNEYFCGRGALEMLGSKIKHILLGHGDSTSYKMISTLNLHPGYRIPVQEYTQIRFTNLHSRVYYRPLHNNEHVLTVSTHSSSFQLRPLSIKHLHSDIFVTARPENKSIWIWIQHVAMSAPPPPRPPPSPTQPEPHTQRPGSDKEALKPWGSLCSVFQGDNPYVWIQPWTQPPLRFPPLSLLDHSSSRLTFSWVLLLFFSPSLSGLFGLSSFQWGSPGLLSLSLSLSHNGERLQTSCLHSFIRIHLFE